MLPGETILSGGKKDKHVSNFFVMQSPAGYYVGTTYTHCTGENRCEKCIEEDCEGLVEPNSRETDYFKTKKDAEMALRAFNETGDLPKQRDGNYVPGKLKVYKIKKTK